jgi:putative SOS response-associated peptidase YedK
LQQGSSAIPSVPLTHARQLLTAERMEWVRDAHKTRRCTCTPASWIELQAAKWFFKLVLKQKGSC